MQRLHRFVYGCLTISRASFAKGFLITTVPFLSTFIDTTTNLAMNTKQGEKQSQSEKEGNASGSSDRQLRILIHGGDNMLGRAVQLSFPIQAPGEERIMDSCTAKHYLDMCLFHPSSSNQGDKDNDDLEIDEIRSRNANHGSYLWGDYIGLPVHPPPDLRLLNLETAVTKSISNADVPRMKVSSGGKSVVESLLDLSLHS